MIIEILLDHQNHQYIIKYKHLERIIDYRIFNQDLLDKIKNEMIEEYRDYTLKKILENHVG